jgi:TRAP-type C4-dicarboxylate transport system permease small subunit
MLAELDQRSQAANIPLVLPQAMLPIGFLLMGLLIAIRLLVRGAPRPDPIASRSDH